MILLDANALMMPAQFRLNLFDEIRQSSGDLSRLCFPASCRNSPGSPTQKGKTVQRHDSGCRLQNNARSRNAGEFLRERSMSR